MSKHPPLLSRVQNDLLCLISFRYLLSYNFEAVHGFTFGVDAIKSILLMCAVVEKINSRGSCAIVQARSGFSGNTQL